MYKLRVDVGEPLEFALVNACEDQLVWRRQSWWCSGEELVEIFPTPATLEEGEGRKGWKEKRKGRNIILVFLLDLQPQHVFQLLRSFCSMPTLIAHFSFAKLKEGYAI